MWPILVCPMERRLPHGNHLDAIFCPDGTVIILHQGVHGFPVGTAAVMPQDQLNFVSFFRSRCGGGLAPAAARQDPQDQCPGGNQDKQLFHNFSPFHVLVSKAETGF